MKKIGHIDTQSTVCIDPFKLRSIREKMQLTQLYVSKVVGVTTDTISRWENNRYPTIRRENALKLAEALEVSLEDILLQPTDSDVDNEKSAKKKSFFFWLVLFLLLLAGLIATGSFFTTPAPQLALVTAERLLPNFAAPGSTIPVQINLTHRAQSGGIILREYFPKNWKIVQASPPASSLDNIHGVARWIIKAGDERDRVVYLVQVGHTAEPGSEGAFWGEIVASRQGNQSAVPVQGETTTRVESVHWVDANGDRRIDDVEMLEGSFIIEDMAGVHIDWDDLEELWDAGSYSWNKKKSQFVPEVQNP